MKEHERLLLIIQAECYLSRARDLLVRAGAKKAANKVRRALKSAGGAVRNRSRFAVKERYSK